MDGTRHFLQTISKKRTLYRERGPKKKEIWGKKKGKKKINLLKKKR
jgi:hypothetical protein